MNRAPVKIHAAGPAVIFLRICRDIGLHFPARVHEWVTAWSLLFWGIIVALPNALFSQSVAWTRMANIAPEQFWGYLAITIGTARVLALIINGTFKSTWYSRFSPHVRAASCLCSSAIWTLIAVGLTDSPYISTGLAVYPALALLDLANAWAATRDAAALDEARSNATEP